MKKVLTLIFSLLLIMQVFSQEKKDTTYWKKGGNFSINMNQISFTNWAAGGLNSVSGTSRTQAFANYQKGITSWDNIIDLGYGLSKVDSSVVKKNDDIIELQSKLDIKAADKLFYSAMLDFKSQFGPGYSDAENKKEISNFLAPAYLTLSFGMDYKPSNKFSIVFAPITEKMTIVTDTSLARNYGLKTGKTTRMEFGALLKAAVNTDIVKNVGMLSEITLFSDYFNHMENIVVDWKVAINMKINDYLSAQLNTQLLYDHNIKFPPVTGKAKVQFKELFGVGLSFKF